MEKEIQRAKTYTILPDDEKLGTATVTCNSVEDAAETAKIFFWTPCRLSLPGDEAPTYGVEKNGSLRRLK